MTRAPNKTRISLLIWAALLVIVRLSYAQPPVIKVETADLDPNTVLAAIKAEIANDPSTDGAELSVVGNSKQVRIKVKDKNGNTVERLLPLQANANQNARDIALVAGNLLRNQHAAILALLKGPPSSSTTSPISSNTPTPAVTNSADKATAQPGDPPVPDPSSGQTDQPKQVDQPGPNTNKLVDPETTTKDKPTTDEAAKEHSENTRTASVTSNPLATIDPCKSASTTIPITVDFAPRVGTTSYTGTNINSTVAFHITAGIEESTTHFSFAAVVGIANQSACRFRFAGVADVVHRDLYGVQFTGVTSIARNKVRGLQASGVVNWAGTLSGAQLSSVNRVANDSSGLQAGVLNVANSSFAGLQIGVANLAGNNVNGAQIGLFNVASNADASVGLLNIAYNGRYDFDMWATDTGSVITAIENSAKYTHTILGGGARFSANGPRGILLWGFGARLYQGHLPEIDLDALLYMEPGNNPFQKQHMLSQMKLQAAWPLNKRFAALTGFTYNLLLADDINQTDISIFNETSISSKDHFVRHWFGATLGLRVNIH